MSQLFSALVAVFVGYAASVAVVLASTGLVAMARDFNALSLGEEGAQQLGVDVERLKRRTFVLGSLLTALAVAVAGMIGFVGLVVPHLLRLALGPDHRLLLPAAFLGGGAFLVIADLAAPGIDVLAWAPRWKGADPAPRLIAYGSHVDVERMARAREAGFDEVMPNSRFHREYRDLLSPAPPR